MEGTVGQGSINDEENANGILSWTGSSDRRDDVDPVGGNNDNKQHRGVGGFVSSMTFAANFNAGGGGGFGGYGCDCDECDCVRAYGRRRRKLSPAIEDEKDSKSTVDESPPDDDDEVSPRPPSFVPETIRKAIQLHQQQKKRLRVTLSPTRTLLGRYYGWGHEDGSDGTTSPPTQDVVSAWEWELPYQAEPSLEFGNSHRLVWIRRCPGILQSIADSMSTAIVVGSSEEQSNRVHLEDWTEGSVVFVPSNGGRAVGYVHAGPSSVKVNRVPATTDYNNTDRATAHDDDDDEEWDQLNQNDVAPLGGRYATLLIVKLPDRLLRDRQVKFMLNDAASHAQQQQLPSWLAPLVPTCQRLLQLQQDETLHPNGNVRESTRKPRYAMLNIEDAQSVKMALASLLHDGKSS